MLKKKGLLVKTILLNDVYRGRRRLSTYIIAHAGFRKEGGEGRKLLEIIDYARKDSLYPQVFIVPPKNLTLEGLFIFSQHIFRFKVYFSFHHSVI